MVSIFHHFIYSATVFLYSNFGGNLLQNEATTITLYIALATVPVVVFSGVLKGYLQGIANISSTAWSQMLEQLIRIGLITFLLPFFVTPENPTLTAAYAMAITAVGEVFLLFTYTLRIYFRKNQKIKIRSKQALPCNATSSDRCTFCW